MMGDANYSDWKDQITQDEFKVLNNAEIPYEFISTDELIEQWVEFERGTVEDDSHEEVMGELNNWLPIFLDEVYEVAEGIMREHM